MKQQLIDRDTILVTVRGLLASPTYSHEIDARVRGLLSLAEKLPGNGGYAASEDEAERRAFGDYLRGIGKRALGIGAPVQDTATSVLGPQGFGAVTSALKATDCLFDPDFCTRITTDTGAPFNFPQIDDTAGAATVATENAADPAEYDPITGALMVIPPSFRTGLVVVSREILEDTGFSLGGLMADSFAIRIARGVGPALVLALKSAAKIGATAVGSSESTGGSETGATSVGWTDLSNLIHSVDPAYRRSPKCGFVMNDDTLLTLDSIICKNGQPLFRSFFDSEGYRLLRGYRVGISPSMDDISSSPATATYPVAFGAFGHYITRIVKQGDRIQTLTERFAEFGQVAFRAWLRVAGALTGVTATESPVKLLQCGA